MVTCHVTLVASAAGIPAINWQTPLQVPPSPTLSSPQEGVFVSELIIDSFNSSHEGTYLCEASVENLAFSVENSLIININPNSRLAVASRVEIQSTYPLQFDIICTSFGGFPASVMWMKGSSVIDGGVTELSDDFTSYRHILTNVTEDGVYICTVSNETPDNASATVNATIPNPPSNLTVTQNGVDSVLVSWTPSDGAELYFIIYEHVLISGMMVVQGTLDSATVRLDPAFSMPGSPFSFMLVAHTALPSVEVGPVDITLGKLDVRLFAPLEGGPVLGRNFTLACDVTVYGDLSGSPVFTWTGPGGALPQPLRTSDGRSELHFDPLLLSQSGEYSCTVEVEGFPFPSTQSIFVNIDFLGTCSRFFFQNFVSLTLRQLVCSFLQLQFLIEAYFLCVSCISYKSKNCCKGKSPGSLLLWYCTQPDV
jgi:hypothetical protein